MGDLTADGHGGFDGFLGCDGWRVRYDHVVGRAAGCGQRDATAEEREGDQRRAPEEAVDREPYRDVFRELPTHAGSFQGCSGAGGVSRARSARMCARCVVIWVSMINSEGAMTINGLLIVYCRLTRSVSMPTPNRARARQTANPRLSIFMG